MEMSPFISLWPVSLTAAGVLIEELAVFQYHYLFKRSISALVSISVSATQPGRLIKTGNG